MGRKSAMMANFNAKKSVAQQYEYSQPFWLDVVALMTWKAQKEISIPHVVRSIDSLLYYTL